MDCLSHTPFLFPFTGAKFFFFGCTATYTGAYEKIFMLNTAIPLN